MSEKRLLRILCLHGAEQNKEVMRAKLGSLPRKAKNIATFTYLDGPIISNACASSSEIDKNGYNRTWYIRNEDKEIDVQSLKDTISYIDSVWNDGNSEASSSFEKHVPFDGILGFSMGGTIATYIASCYPSKYSSLKFVFVAGAPDRIPCDIIEPNHPSKVSPDIHSLHVMGESDNVVSMELMQSLADRFHEPVIITHEQGHCIPTKAVDTKQYVDFLKEMFDSMELNK